eukprot:1200681-Amorphochlora_amoeboformis.AAC.1
MCCLRKLTTRLWTIVRIRLDSATGRPKRNPSTPKPTERMGSGRRKEISTIAQKRSIIIRQNHGLQSNLLDYHLLIPISGLPLR